jgi:hypothetical protein
MIHQGVAKMCRVYLELRERAGFYPIAIHIGKTAVSDVPICGDLIARQGSQVSVAESYLDARKADSSSDALGLEDLYR